MAKKKAKKKGNGKKKSGGKFGIDFQKMLGIGAGILAKKKGIDKIEFLNNIEDPKMRALAVIGIGEYGPKIDFIKGMIKEDKLLTGAGDAIITLGMDQLLTEMNIAGVGAQANESDDLAVVIDGIDDIDAVNNDRLSSRKRRRRDEDEIDEDVLADDDDIDAVNDDEDEVSEDVLADDDIDAVNDDEDEDY